MRQSPRPLPRSGRGAPAPTARGGPRPARRAPLATPAPPAERRWQPTERIEARPSAPGAAAALALGTVGLGFWFLGPFAWWQGARARRAIRRSGGQLGGYGTANIGMVLGILETIGMVTALIVIGILVAIGEEAS